MTFPRNNGGGPTLTIQTETRRAPETSWWAFAPRESFFAICYANYLDHMRGSEAERPLRVVNGKRVYNVTTTVGDEALRLREETDG